MMYRTTWMAAAGLLAAGALAAGCGSDPKPPPEAPVTNERTTLAADAPKPAETAQPENVSGIQVDKRIREMCALPEAHFEFDSAAVGADAKAMLNALAACFLTGAAKDKNMALVGHCDPRGEAEYNLALGQRRASAVEGYLASQGLGPTRLASSSRGELEATGTDEATWAYDRRVDITLAE